MIIVCAVLSVSATRRLAAQDAPPTAWGRAPDVGAAAATTTGPWLGGWSPLRPITDIGRGGVRAPDAPGLHRVPAPYAGAFVLAGAPAALARDFQPRLAGDTARWGEVTYQYASETGAFRRPFDVADRRVTQLGGQGWAPVGARGIAIGRFVLDRESSDVSSFTQRALPYGSSPFVAADSVSPPLQGTRARLEGALGLRLGPLALGAAAGIDTREHNSIDFPLRRSGRATIPAASLGAEYLVPRRAIRMGAYYRWSEAAEQNLLNPVPLPIVIYAVAGLDEPLGISTNTGQPSLVRTERRGAAVGATLDATLLGARIVVSHERGTLAEDQYRTLAAVRPTDEWRAEASETRLQVQRMLGRNRLTVVGSQQTLTGDGTRYDLRGVAVRGRDERTAVEADLRAPMGTRWQGAVFGGVVQQSHVRTDFVAELTVDLMAPTPFGGIEVVRRMGRGGRAALAAGASVAQRSPSGTVPPAASRGENYRKFTGAALAYDGSVAQAGAGWLRLQVPVRTRALVLGGRMDAGSGRAIDGRRTMWRLELALQ